MSLVHCFTGSVARIRRRNAARASCQGHKEKPHRNDVAEQTQYKDFCPKAAADVDLLLGTVAMCSSNGGEDRNVYRARQLMAAVDQSDLFDEDDSLERQVDILQTLQDLAYRDADSGGISDMAEWCLRGWLRVLEHHPEEVRVLTGQPRRRSNPSLSITNTLDSYRPLVASPRAAAPRSHRHVRQRIVLE